MISGCSAKRVCAEARPLFSGVEGVQSHVFATVGVIVKQLELRVEGALVSRHLWPTV